MIRQLFVAAGDAVAGDQDAFERKLYVIRRRFELEGGADAIVPSFSSRTIVYKGMLTAPQLRGYFPDLQDERTESALALVHSRFSTNTFPSWELAHPYRMIAHNGEINTVRGNINWMRARESQLASELFGDDLAKVLPVVQAGGSDSATLDNVLELLVLGGRSLPHAIMMMIPEATAGRTDLPPELLGFYAYHQCLMEAWDGPAAVSFTDGRVIGATLDRNGLRPGRWLETRDGWVVLASEAGVLDIPAADVLRKGRLQPGKLFLVDLEQGRIVPNDEAKLAIATQQPYAEWFDREVVELADLPAREPQTAPTETLRQRQIAFGYTQEDMKVTLAPLARNAEEAVSSMGNDTPLAVLSSGNRILYSYFKQLFAQVTNPPIDSIREAIVMSLAGEHRLGEEPLRGDAGACAPARAPLADPARRRARAAAPGALHDLQGAHARYDVARLRGPGRARRRPRAPLPRGRRRARRRGRTSSSSPTAPSARSAPRCRRSSRSRRSTTTSSARERASRPASSSRRARRGASTASRR